MKQCKYPSCRIKATNTWALVSLCKQHYESIKEETDRFYGRGRNGYSGHRSEIELRPHYLQISHLIPWSKENLGQLRELQKEGSR